MFAKRELGLHNVQSGDSIVIIHSVQDGVGLTSVVAVDGANGDVAVGIAHIPSVSTMVDSRVFRVS